MGAKTGISWCDSTWNPLRGCSRVSQGCVHCYAETVAGRFGGPGLPYEGLTKLIGGERRWTDKIMFVEQMLDQPLRWKKSRRIFVNSMSDLFHENLPIHQLDRIMLVMILAEWHIFQVLTKRHTRMQLYLSDPNLQQRLHNVALGEIDDNTVIGAAINRRGRPMMNRLAAGHETFLNVWWGVSVEDQDAANERIPALAATPARVRFISAEPLLNAIVLTPAMLAALDWVIVGGESGPRARPMHPDWAWKLRDQCANAGVPFFFKQWGNWVAELDVEKDDPDGRAEYWKWKNKPQFRVLNRAGGQGFHGERVHIMRNVGKEAAGDLLNGVQYQQMPETFL